MPRHFFNIRTLEDDEEGLNLPRIEAACLAARTLAHRSAAIHDTSSSELPAVVSIS
jgi:hypothetical protein